MNQATKVHEDPVSVSEIQAIWQLLVLPQRVSIVALQEGTPGANLELGKINKHPASFMRIFFNWRLSLQSAPTTHQ